MASENIINRFSKTYDWNTSTKKVDNTEEVEAQKENIVKLPIKEVIDKFIKGNMTLEALAVWCNGNNCEVTTATQSSTAYTISFKFQGKTYKVVSNIDVREVVASQDILHRKAQIEGVATLEPEAFAYRYIERKGIGHTLLQGERRSLLRRGGIG